MKEKTRLLVVMSHRALGESLAKSLEAEGFVVVGLMSSLAQAARANGKKAPHIILFEPPVDTLEAEELRPILDQIGDVATVMLSEPRNRIAWMSKGVRAFARPDRPIADLVQTLNSAVSRDEICEPEVAYEMFTELASLETRRRFRRQSQASLLTHRERQVLDLLCEGLGNRKIADELCLSTHTVKNHVHHVLSKLGVETRWEAAAKAQSSGWASRGPSQ